jgi:hypothetical protein
LAKPIGLELYEAYHKNGVMTGYLEKDSDYILCPLCLGKIERTDVESRKIPVEHIIPQHSTADRLQKTRHTKIGVKNVRSGLTLTCYCCNSWKGSKLDWLMRNKILPGSKPIQDYQFETGTAILTYAYLFSFAVWGYEYIHKPEMERIREQFKHPSERKSEFLAEAKVNLKGPEQPIVCNRWGYPFIMGGMSKGPLEVMFWRFRALLPSLHGVKTSVEIPETILKLADK